MASGAAVESWLHEIPAGSPSTATAGTGSSLGWTWSGGPASAARTAKPPSSSSASAGAASSSSSSMHCDYIPDALGEFLGGGYTFVGVGVEANAERLWNDYELDVAYPEDLAELAAWMERPDLAKRAAVMDVHIEKSLWVRTGRWDVYYLSGEQIKYASIDAFVSFEVGRRLLSADY